MAVTTTLGQVARGVSTAVGEFAALEGWQPGEFGAVASLDPRTGFLFIVVGSIRPVDRYRWHAGIKRNLRDTFEDSSLASFNVLDVREVDSLDAIHAFLALGEDEIDLTDML